MRAQPLLSMNFWNISRSCAEVSCFMGSTTPLHHRGTEREGAYSRGKKDRNDYSKKPRGMQPAAPAKSRAGEKVCDSCTEEQKIH
jgi:hypothetical protein